MADVTIWGSLRRYTDGAETVEVAASTSRELLEALVAAYPGLADQVAAGVSLSIDGEVYKDAWFTPINPDSEVILMPLMVGG